MRLRVATLLILVAGLCASANAQSNCCDIHVGGTNDQINTTTVQGPQGGTYVANETQTTPIACLNSGDSNKACNGVNMPNNVVTAIGAGSYNTTLGKFVICNPVFSPKTTPQTLEPLRRSQTPL